MFKNIFNYLKGPRSEKPEQESSNQGKSEIKRSPYSTIIIEESFTLKGPEGDSIFKICFEVPVPLMDSSDKIEIEKVKNSADATFRPVVIALKHYLAGLCHEQSSERFLVGRENLITAIKHCAMVQINAIEDAEKNR